MSSLIKVKVLIIVMCLLISGCNRFASNNLASSFGYQIDECEVRDTTHHASYQSDGTNSGRARISARKFRCRIERICINKSEAENEACRKSARSYYGFDERDKNWPYFKNFDDKWDAICTLNKNPFDPNFKGCHPKWKSQDNFDSNPFYDQKLKKYKI